MFYKKKVGLIYRSNINQRYSIETLFSPLEKDRNIKKIVLPHDLNSLVSLIKLLIFSFNIKTKIIHITGDVHYIAFFLFWKKSIITIHDLNHYEELTGIRKKIYGFLWFSLPLFVANKIVAISPYTKLQLLKYFRVDENKIVVIPNSFLKFESQISNFSREGPSSFQILCIGNTSNKNIDRLLDAIEGLNLVSLRLIGKQSSETIIKLNSKKINFTIACNLTRNELAIEYKSSDILYFASTKEGFGLPILEAQSLGIPVITSNSTAMPYVAGEGAVIVDPYSTESIRESILLFINKKIDIEDLKKKGFDNLERFSQFTFISAYQDLYKFII